MILPGLVRMVSVALSGNRNRFLCLMLVKPDDRLLILFRIRWKRRVHPPAVRGVPHRVAIINQVPSVPSRTKAW